MLGSPTAGEVENARDKLIKLLTKHGLTWNDLPAILAATEPPGATSSSASHSQQPSDPPQVNVLDLVLRLIELHLALTPEQRIAMRCGCYTATSSAATRSRHAWRCLVRCAAVARPLR